VPITNGSALTAAEKRRLLTPPVGTIFDPYERVFGSYDNGTVFDYGDFDVRDLASMLRKDGKARSLEQVLTLPLRGATWKIEPDKNDNGQQAFVQANLGDKLDKLIDQCTTAVTFRRAFFETTWALDGDKIVYDCIDWRPPAGCEPGFNPATGAPKGFRQRMAPLPGVYSVLSSKSGSMPGYEIVKQQRSYIYVHGSFREPVKGLSDLDVAYWCYETKQKILFLWFQFLENQSLPKTVVYGDDVDHARELAGDVAGLKSSGVLGLPRPADPTMKAFEILESSGAGAAQFYQAIQYLDAMMPASVLAGFTELPQAAVQGTGSYALSADQSEFFLASRQAVADEIAESIRADVFGPLVHHNFGAKAPVPKLTIGPLSSRYQQRALTLLQSVIQSRYANVPRDFVDQLVTHTATFLGLDEVAVRDAIRKDQAAAATAQAQAAAQAASGVPGKPKAGGEKGLYSAAPPPATGLSKAVHVAYELVTRAQAGESPESVLIELTERAA
jgi:hypothetical protein